jgi:predicted metal-binding membrane protein
VTEIARLVARDPARWLILPAAAWAVLLFLPHWTPQHAAHSDEGAHPLEIIAMIVAMMLPLVIGQMNHLSWRARSGGVRAALCFSVTYCLVWLAACAILGAIATLTESLPAPVAVLCALGLGLAWQETAFKQAAVRRCHYLPPVRADGLGLLADSCALGLRIGRWCVAGCWPWMLLCIVVRHNLAAMFVLSCALWFECYGAGRPITLSERLA